MMRFIRPRLRVPVAVAVLGTAATAAVVVSQGWTTAIYVAIAWVVLAVGYYIWGGKDSDVGAVIGSRADERQASLEMKVTALQGKVMTAAAAVAFLIAVAVKATIWPFAIFVALAGLSGFAGWAIYRQDGSGQDDGVDAEHAQPPIPIKPGL
jgi:hypothetical protein